METKLSRTINALEEERALLLTRAARFERAIAALREEQEFTDDRVDPLEGLELAPRTSETRALRDLHEEYSEPPSRALAIVRQETPPPPARRAPSPTVEKAIAIIRHVGEPLSFRVLHMRIAKRGASPAATHKQLKDGVRDGHLRRSGTRNKYRYHVAV